jgi:hypothetical protein
MGFDVCDTIAMSIGGDSAMEGWLTARLGWVMVAAMRGDATISRVK